MCGIFGAVKLTSNQPWNRGIIRALTWANRERGTDSLGFFDSSGKMTKGAGDPSDVLNKARIKDWINYSQKNSWFIAGHTRLATRGSVNRRNSHPFRYGRIIGSHNGMCDAPRKFQVDSEYLLWSLNKKRGDYQKALTDISGYWGLSWFDGEYFYLMCHSGELSYDTVGGVFYYSSSGKHLNSCTGGNATRMTSGQVIRISQDGVIENSSVANSLVAEFKSTCYDYSSYSIYDDSGWRSKEGYFNKKGYTTPSSYEETRDYLDRRDGSCGGKVEPETRDYDYEWQTAWGEYCTTSEHAVCEDTNNDHYAG